MPQFVHLHVHTQYSILDGQASVQRLVDKAMADGQPGIAVTDHGDMFGIKEFYNYVQKVKGKYKDKAAEAEARIAALRDGTETLRRPRCGDRQMRKTTGGVPAQDSPSSPSSAARSTWRAAGSTTRRASPTRAATT